MKRKRGAPPGNQNNFKHGFYSRQFTRQESLDLSQPSIGALQDEIILLKVILDRIARHLKPGSHPALTFRETVLTLHVAAQAVSRLNSFYRSSQLISPQDDSGIRAFLRDKGFTEAEIRQEIQELTLAADEDGVHVQPDPNGFYASGFAAAELPPLAHLDEQQLDDETSLLRILIKRTLNSLKTGRSESARLNPGDPITYLDKLQAYRVIIYAASCLERLERTRAFVFHRKRPSVGLLSLALKQVWAELALEHPGLSAAPPADQPFSPN